MHKITQDELTNLSFKEKRTLHPQAKVVYENIAKLLIGESLFIRAEEWPYKTEFAPSFIPKKYVLPHARFSVRRLKDNSAFVVTRYE